MVPIEVLKAEYCLSWQGIHGFPHWQRVSIIGSRLAEITGANSEIVELFAYLHDLKRWNNGSDYEHGKRAAEFINKIQGVHIHLSERDLKLLKYACEFHTCGFTQADITVQTCWDADRLDLGRVGIRPDPKYLCTDAAKDQSILEWAYLASVNQFYDWG